MEAVIDGGLSVTFLYSLFDKHYNFNDDVLVLIVQAAIEGKTSIGLIETKAASLSNLPAPAKKQIVEVLINGNWKEYYLELENML